MLLDWLGIEFRDLFPLLKNEQRQVCIAVTRPSGWCYGEGALRVVRVQDDVHSVHILLAYERYCPPYDSHKRKKRGQR